MEEVSFWALKYTDSSMGLVAVSKKDGIEARPRISQDGAIVLSSKGMGERTIPRAVFLKDWALCIRREEPRQIPEDSMTLCDFARNAEKLWQFMYKYGELPAKGTTPCGNMRIKVDWEGVCASICVHTFYDPEFMNSRLNEIKEGLKQRGFRGVVFSTNKCTD